MPLSESRPDSICFSFARSLYEVAIAKGGRPLVEEIQSELEDVVEMARVDRQFGELLSSPAVRSTARAASLDRMFKGRVSELTYNFMQVLNKRNRLAELAAMTAAYDSVVQEGFGRVEVNLYTAEPLAPGDAEPLRARLASVLGKDVVIHPYVDSTMIGGVKLQIGDQLLDGSVSTKLRKMRDALANEGAARLRGKFDAILGL